MDGDGRLSTWRMAQMVRLRYTQVGFEQGDEKKYEKAIQEVLAAP